MLKLKYDVMRHVLPASHPLAPVQSVAFGMGSGLLQKLNRDTLSFATKLSFIR